MGLEWTKGSPAGFSIKVDGILKQFADQAAVIVDETVKDGRDVMKEVIATSGTGYVGKGARATPEGRIDTGAMYDGVTSSMIGKTQGRFGWKNPKKYYRTQEYEPTPRGFPPMHSLMTAYMKVRVEFERKIRKLVK